jgi:hypothetical protein
VFTFQQARGKQGAGADRPQRAVAIGRGALAAGHGKRREGKRNAGCTIIADPNDNSLEVRKRERRGRSRPALYRDQSPGRKPKRTLRFGHITKKTLPPFKAPDKTIARRKIRTVSTNLTGTTLCRVT